MTVLSMMLNQNTEEYCNSVIFCLCIIATVEPTSEKISVKAMTIIAIAISPKSDLSSNLVNIESLTI